MTTVIRQPKESETTVQDLPFESTELFSSLTNLQLKPISFCVPKWHTCS